jgi:hypothetical protein
MKSMLRHVPILAMLLAACGPMDPSEEVSLSESNPNLTGTYLAGVRFRTTANVNYRTGPGTSYSIIQVLPVGSFVYSAVTAPPSNGFYRVRFEGYDGWVSGNYVVFSREPLIAWGVHPMASDALRAVGVTAGEITQTIGGAAASAGTHLQDGTSSDGQPYTAAVDITASGKSEATIKTLLQNLGWAGFAAWYRKPGYDGWPVGEIEHIHAVYAAVPMKDSLDRQISDYHEGLNGLASHTPYGFYQWTPGAKDTVWDLWTVHN